MKKQGFTLIELLAVIVILAIIALIAVPIVINIINDSKKESQQRSVDLYMDSVKKNITQENMKVKYDPDRCEIQENGNVKCYKGEEILKISKGLDELKIEMNGKKPMEGTIIFNNNKISYENVLLEGLYFHMNTRGEKSTTQKKINENSEDTVEEENYITEEEDYRGYYADVDGDGAVDGIIYADLAYLGIEEVSGDWYNTNLNDGEGDGTYSYYRTGAEREYVISKNTFKANDGFGEKEIITLKNGSVGTPRFYVMALEDFTTTDYTTFYWYNNAWDFEVSEGRMSTYANDTSVDFETGYANTGNMIEIWNKNGAGTGSYIGAIQDNRDIWKHIQTKYQEGWFIPSRGEWAAFADYLTKKQTNPLQLSTQYDYGNYNSLYELSSSYLSSSQRNTGTYWYVIFSSGCIDWDNISIVSHVRLSTTF